MSQPGLLNEEEIRSFINENFNLKTEREPYLRPTREFVIDIYTRFLDQLYPRWRRPKIHFDEPDMKVLMVRGISKLVTPFSTFTFYFGDLLIPARKRTTSFLNVLIYLRVLYEENLADFQQVVDNCAASKEGSDKLKEELSRKRLQLDEAILRQASIGSIEKVKRDLAEEKKLFDLEEQKSESLNTEAANIKERIKSIEENLLRKEVELTTLKKANEEWKNLFQLISEQAPLDEKLSDLKQTQVTVARDQEFKIAQRKLELEREIASTKDRTTKSSLYIKNLMAEKQSIREEYNEEESRIQSDSEKCRVYIEKSNLKVEAMMKRKLQSDRSSQALAATLANSKIKLDTLLGIKTTETELPANRTYQIQSHPEKEVPANRTYIKEGST